MTIAEWCKFQRENENLSDEELAVKAWKFQRENIRERIMQQEQERFEKAAAKKIEEEIEKNLGKMLEEALFGGKSSMNIEIKL